MSQPPHAPRPNQQDARAQTGARPRSNAPWSAGFGATGRLERRQPGPGQYQGSQHQGGQHQGGQHQGAPSGRPPQSASWRPPQGVIGRPSEGASGRPPEGASAHEVDQWLATQRRRPGQSWSPGSVQGGQGSAPQARLAGQHPDPNNPFTSSAPRRAPRAFPQQGAPGQAIPGAPGQSIGQPGANAAFQARPQQHQGQQYPGQQQHQGQQYPGQQQHQGHQQQYGQPQRYGQHQQPGPSQYGAQQPRTQQYGAQAYAAQQRGGPGMPPQVSNAPWSAGFGMTGRQARLQPGQPQNFQPQFAPGQRPGFDAYGRPLQPFPGTHGPGTYGPGTYGAPGSYTGHYLPAPRRKSRFGLVMTLMGLVIVGLMAGYAVLTLNRQESTGVVYQSDDYQVPDYGQIDSPVPDPTGSDTVLTNNKLYSQAIIKPIRCEAPQASPSNSDEVEQRLVALSACVTRHFGPAIEAAGYTIVQPRVSMYSGKATTPCGRLPSHNAVYCSANQQIYVATNLYEITGPDQTAMDFVFAHEFGHSVQARVGILTEGHWDMSNTQNKSEKLATSRRLEMQADCFSGTYLQSVAQSQGYDDNDYQAALKAVAAVGDDTHNIEEGDHGQSQSRVAWTKSGLEATTYQQCNTFTAPANKVR